jgi:predicted MFS family arabinose efflux permease
VQGIANLFYILAIYLFFKEGKTNFSKEKHPSMIAGLKEITKIDTSLFIFFLSLTFVTIGSINLSKYIDVYFNELGYNPQELGNFVMATGFVSLFASLVLVPIFAKKKRQLLTISLIHISSAVIVLFVFRSSNFLLVAYTVYMAYIIFRTIYQPLEQNYISSYGKQGKFGGIMGLRQSFVSVGMVTGPLIGGFLYQRKPLFLFDFSAAMFIIGVALLGIVALIEKNKIVEKPAV